MKKIFAILCMFALVGCGEDSKLREAVRARLKDPDSANFKDAVVSSNGLRSCIPWNAKNEMGGYSGWKVAELKKKNLEWEATFMDGNGSGCTEDDFRRSDVTDLAYQEAEQRAKDWLGTEKSKYCISIVSAYVTRSESMARTSSWGLPIPPEDIAKVSAIEANLKARNCTVPN